METKQWILAFDDDDAGDNSHISDTDGYEEIMRTTTMTQMVTIREGPQSLIQPCDGFVSCIASWEAEECIRTHAHYTSLHGDDGKLQIRAETRHGRAQTTSLCCVVTATMCHTYGLRPPRGSTLAMRGVSPLFDTSRACGSPRPPREETLKAAVCRSYMVAHGAVSTAGPRPRCRRHGAITCCNQAMCTD